MTCSPEANSWPPVLHSWVVGAIRAGRTVRGVLFESNEGRRGIVAKVVADTAGDLGACAGARVTYESDVDSDQSPVAHCAPMTTT